jgi:hypothetical protein
MMHNPSLRRTTPSGKCYLENSLSIFMSLGAPGDMPVRRKSSEEGKGEDWVSENLCQCARLTRHRSHQGKPETLGLRE